MKLIHFEEKTKTFRIDAGSSSYAFYVDPEGHLRSIYWGPRLDTMDLQWIAGDPKRERPVGSEPEDLGVRPYACWEFNSNDTGIFATPSAVVRNADGNQATDPTYVGHRILPGKPALPGLPATYVDDDDEAETLEITMLDETTKVEFLLRYTAFRDLPVLARSMAISNRGDAPVELCGAASLTTSFRNEDFDVCYFDGMWGDERCFHREAVCGGTRVFSSSRGHSGHSMNPSVILCDPAATETAGRAYGAVYVFSGNFAITVHREAWPRTSLTVGVNSENFRWHLEPGDSFQTPEALQTVSDNGLGELSRTFHDLFRQHLIPRRWRKAPRPLLCNNWESMGFDFNREKLLELGRTAKSHGIEFLVLDDGWFGHRDSDNSSLGDWFANTEKLGCTLGELGDDIRALGLKFGLWFEPEMVSPDSELFRAHPDWAIQCPNRVKSLGRHQLMLDFSRQEVVDHVFAVMSKAIAEAKLDYMKWDCNRAMTEAGSLALPPERQGEVAYRHILGVYELYRRLEERFPEMLIEGCSGGGGRFDAGILAYAPQSWASDNTDPYCRLLIQYGTSFFYPCSSMGAHIAVDNQRFPGRQCGIDTRAAVAFAGTFGYELDLNAMPPEDLAKVPAQCEMYHKLHHLVEQGDYYRLSNPWKENIVAWMNVAKDQSEFLLTIVAVRGLYAFFGKNIRLPGLDEDAIYTDGEHTWTGKCLAHAGIDFRPKSCGDLQSCVIHAWKK